MEPSERERLEMSIRADRIAGNTEQQMLEIALESLAAIKREYQHDLDPSAAADEIVSRTGVDFDTAALAAFSD